jgi:hypothetical protein
MHSQILFIKKNLLKNTKPNMTKIGAALLLLSGVHSESDTRNRKKVHQKIGAAMDQQQAGRKEGTPRPFSQSYTTAVARSDCPRKERWMRMGNAETVHVNCSSQFTWPGPAACSPARSCSCCCFRRKASGSGDKAGPCPSGFLQVSTKSKKKYSVSVC